MWIFMASSGQTEGVRRWFFVRSLNKVYLRRVGKWKVNAIKNTSCENWTWKSSEQRNSKATITVRFMRRNRKEESNREWIDRNKVKGEEAFLAKKPYSGKQRTWFRSNNVWSILLLRQMHVMKCFWSSVQGDCSIQFQQKAFQAKT